MTEEHAPYLNESQEKQPRLIRDGRDDLPIFIHSELDELEMSLEAFRVYAHLARRAGKNGMAFPSYQSMGEKCFRQQYPKASAETLRRKAIAAVKELVELGLITKRSKTKPDGSHNTNDYMLTPRSQWGGGVNAPGVVSTHPVVSTHQGGVNAPGVVSTHPVVSTHQGSVNAPKDTPIEDTPIEDTPIEDTPIEDQISSSTRSARRKKKEATPPHPMTNSIRDAYVKAVGRKLPPSAFQKISPDAKFAAEEGILPEQIEQTYAIMKLEDYWRDKTIPLRAVLDKIANTKMTIRNRREASNGATEDNGGWDADELAAIKAARAAGDHELAGRIIREGNKRWKERMSQMQGSGLAGK